MTGEPTLHYGDQSADGWVEYLQQLLLGVAPHLASDGIFGDHTINAVYTFQQQNGLMVDGVVGNQTWAALRGEEATPIGTDGHQHQETDHGIRAIWFEDQNAHGRTGEYSDMLDGVMFFLESVGDTVIPDNDYYLDVNFTAPDGAIHHKEGPLANISGEGQSKPGDMLMTTIEGLKAELGSGSCSYVADIPDGLGGGRHEGTFTIA